MLVEVYKWSNGYLCFLSFEIYYHTNTDWKFLFLIRFCVILFYSFFLSIESIWEHIEWTGSRFFPTTLLLVSPFALRFDIVRVASILQKERNVIWDFRVGVVRLKGSCKIFAWIANKVSRLQSVLGCFVTFYACLRELIGKWLSKRC